MRKMTRRKFLKSLFLSGLGFFLVDRSRPAFARTQGLPILRPPGSLDEENFVDKCLRCAECVKVCPARCLKPMPLSEGLGPWLTPRIIPRQAGCIRCGSCARVCPSGAIQKVAQDQVKIGTASIDPRVCLVWTSQRACLVCREYCPVQAVATDGQGRPQVNPAVCVGCGVCEENCPVLEAQAAIRVAPDGEKRYFLKERRYRSVRQRLCC